MSESNSTSATGARPRSPWYWRWLRWSFIGLATIITLYALYCAEENWRGRRAWLKYRAALIAKGEHLDFQYFIPPEAPDDQNFAAIPFLKPLFEFRKDRQPGESAWADTNAFNKVINFAREIDAGRSKYAWTDGSRIDLSNWVQKMEGKDKPAKEFASRAEAAKELLMELQKFEPQLDELREAAKRPESRFNLRYSDGFAMLIPHDAVLRRLVLLCQLRACSELAVGQTDKAAADIWLMFRLIHAVESEPIVITQLVRMAMMSAATQPIWEGIVRHQWSGAQLDAFDGELRRLDFLADYQRSLRAERASCVEFIEQMRANRKLGANTDVSDIPLALSHLIPSGWFYQNELLLSRLHQEIALPSVDVSERRVYPEQFARIPLFGGSAAVGANDELAQQIDHGFKPYRFFVGLLIPPFQRLVQKASAAQSRVDLCRVAIALERYRLDHREYPESLDSLKAQYLHELPHDLYTGEPLKYRREDGGKYVLYSVGWDKKDEGGAVVEQSDASQASGKSDKGDISWKFPEKAE